MNLPILKGGTLLAKLSCEGASSPKVKNGDTASLRSQNKEIVASIPHIKNSYFNSATLDILCGLITYTKFLAGTNVMIEGETIQPALYIVGSGKFQVTTRDGITSEDGRNTIVEDGKYFGEENLIMDVGKKRRLSIDSATLAELSDTEDSILFVDYDDDCQTVAKYSVEAIEDSICGVIYLKDMRSIIDTTTIGQTTTTKSKNLETVSKLEHLKRHSILGQGEFGQVWLASLQSDDDETEELKKPYALKIQSKHQLATSHQEKCAMREMEIMSELNNNPFILTLVKTFQDENFMYMLLGYIPGGDLNKRIHTKKMDGLPESDTRFYTAGILEALSFMHKRQIVYRDLKPENVLIDHRGYPILIDFGLAKHIPDDKTYTRCGSPCYTAPEVIKVNVGYGLSADNWSLGCLVHEMITGDKPFEGHATQLALYRAICSGYLEVHPLLAEHDKAEALDLIQRLLVVDPSERLGTATSEGGEGIVHHAWFQDKIDFCSLRKKAIPAPWIPTIRHAFDASNFEADVTDLRDVTKIRYPEIVR